METSTWYLIGSIMLGILTLLAGFCTSLILLLESQGLGPSASGLRGVFTSFLTIALLSGCIYCGYEYGHVTSGGGVALLGKGAIYETLCSAKDGEVVYATVKDWATGKVTLCSLTKEPPKLFTKTEGGTLVAVNKEE